MFRLSFLFCSLALLGFAQLATALELPGHFGDGMVIQRDKPVTISGRTPTDGAISARLNGEEVAQTESAKGGFTLTLPPQPAGGPHVLELKGPGSEVVLSDILFGELWFASGQSNMELPISRVRALLGQTIDSTYLPLVRYFDVERGYRFDGPAEQISKRPWLRAVPAESDAISAVAFFFARDLYQRLQIPIGIIDASYGGTTAEGWISKAALEKFPQHAARLEQLAQPGYVAETRARDAERETAWQAHLAAADLGLRSQPAWHAPEFDHVQWRQVMLPNSWADVGFEPGPAVHWARTRIELPVAVAGLAGEIELSAIVDADEVWINGQRVGGTTYRYPPRRYPIAAGVLKAGSNTIAVRVVSRGDEGGLLRDKPMALRVGGSTFDLAGAWHAALGAKLSPPPKQEFSEYMQPGGFYNAMAAALTKTPIAGVIWYQGESNVGRAEEYEQLMSALITDWRDQWGQPELPFIQVQLAGYLAADPLAPSSPWAQLRHAQRQVAEKLPRVAAVPAYDVGEWNDIHPQDKATPARRLALAARQLVYGEEHLQTRGPSLKTAVANADGAVLRFEQLGSGLAVKGDSLRGFTAVAADGQRHPVTARLQGNEVHLTFPAQMEIKAVTYAWANNPAAANLINLEGWPAEPFWRELTTE